jgi:sulfonate transport system permease protein
VAPAALPPVLVGLRYGLSQAWLTLVAAELVGTTSGMGYLIVESRELFQLDVVLAAIAVLGATGVALDGALSLVASRLLAWRPRGF